MVHLRKLYVRLFFLSMLFAYSSFSLGSTFVSADLESLTKYNSDILVGKVKGVSSYWNGDGSFIYTDVTIVTKKKVKGKLADEFTITLMGGSVGGTTSMIVGGPELDIGKEYVLFLNTMNMPGKNNALTIKEHVQGIFDLVEKNGETRAISQATRGGVSLMKNSKGLSSPPGRDQGLELRELISQIKNTESKAGVKK